MTAHAPIDVHLRGVIHGAERLEALRRVRVLARRLPMWAQLRLAQWAVKPLRVEVQVEFTSGRVVTVTTLPVGPYVQVKVRTSDDS